MDDSRIKNKWPFAREGIPFIVVSAGVTFFCSYLGLLFLSVFAGSICVFIIFFFRDPNRNKVAEHKAVLAPADGRILEVQHIKDNDNYLGQPAIKVSIFMSVFNVHVNRIPAESTIKKITYHAGNFFSANLDKASKYNENNRIILQTPEEQTIVLIQIAGLIARRISCWVKEGDQLSSGQRFGLIRFGSRVELYLPGDSRVLAQLRQKVRAGETIIGYLS